MPLSLGWWFCPPCHLLPNYYFSSPLVFFPLTFQCLLLLFMFNPVWCFFSVTESVDRSVCTHTQQVTTSKQGTNLQWLLHCPIMIFNYSRPTQDTHRNANKLSASVYLLEVLLHDTAKCLTLEIKPKCNFSLRLSPSLSTSQNIKFHSFRQNNEVGFPTVVWTCTTVHQSWES